MRRLLLGALAAVAILIAAIAVWFTGSNFHTVIPGELYRSAQLKPGELEEVIKRYGIRTIVNLRGTDTEELWYRDQRKKLADLGLVFHDVSLASRNMPDVTELAKLLDALRHARRPLLVHCRGGADRSGLASALVLLLGGKHKISDAMEQTSLFYRVIYDDSVGRQFLRQYESWLTARRQEHTPQRLLAWIGNDYDDNKGNLLFFFDGVNGRVARRRQDTFRVENNSIRAWGWAIDLWRQSTVGGLTVLLDGRPLETRYGLARPDVAENLGFPAVVNSGWEARTDVSGWKRKCYGASLHVTRRDGSEWRSPSLATICLD